jgi:D-tyrosyl-tRNA(Tyr) deacylase
MLALIQRVSHASVMIKEESIAKINAGILAFIGIEKTDTEFNADKLLVKMLNYRIFADNDDKMNLSLKDTRGGLLLVSQFTLVADTQSGMRPGFSTAMPPEESGIIFQYMISKAQLVHENKVFNGEFGANMQVELCNDGPVTFLLKG